MQTGTWLNAFGPVVATILSDSGVDSEDASVCTVSKECTRWNAMLRQPANSYARKRARVTWLYLCTSIKCFDLLRAKDVGASDNSSRGELLEPAAPRDLDRVQASDQFPR